MESSEEQSNQTSQNASWTSYTHNQQTKTNTNGIPSLTHRTPTANHKRKPSSKQSTTKTNHKTSSATETFTSKSSSQQFETKTSKTQCSTQLAKSATNMYTTGCVTPTVNVALHISRSKQTPNATNSQKHSEARPSKITKRQRVPAIRIFNKGRRHG